MRIVIDMQGAQTESRFRGIGRYTLAFAQAVVRNRGEHEVILAVSGLFPETIEPIRAAFDDLLPQSNIRVWQAPDPVRECQSGNDSRRKAAELLREAFLASLQPDVIHITSLFEGYVDDAVTSIGRFDVATPVSVSLYDLIPLQNPDHYLKSNSQYEQYYLRKIASLQKAACFLAISEFSRQEIVEVLDVPVERVVNISTAIDDRFQLKNIDEAAANWLRQKIGITRPFLLYTGGADERKNLPRLIEAYAALPMHLRDRYQVVFAGKMSEGDVARLKAVAKKNALKPGELLFTGYINDDELVQLYNLCQLFVFPSWHEGFGLPVLEAMACGATAIGAHNTSLPEVIGLPEALFDPLDVAAITRKIVQALEDEGFRALLKEQGLAQVKKFSWDDTATRAIVAWECLNKTQSRQVSNLPLTGRKPRLAFVSPLPPERTGIADYSADLIPALAKHYEIELVVAEGAVVEPWLNQHGKVRDVAWLRGHASEIDRVLYQIGNSPFHRHMLPLLEEIPGVVVLHDFYLSGLMAWREMHGGEAGAWVHSLYDSHGYGSVRDRYRDAEAAKYHYPVNWRILQHAQGVIVHSDYSRRLAQHWYGDNAASEWEVMPLVRASAGKIDKQAARKKLGIDAKDFVVCSFGFLDITKLNHRLLQAWLETELASNQGCRLIFVGENNGGDYGASLLRSISDSGLGERILITGFTAPEVFRMYLAAADIAVQLRTHSRGETSAAVLDCMNHGLPLIVNSNGSMAEIDHDKVWMLPDEFSDKMLLEVLQTLWRDFGRRQTLGARARGMIQDRHSPDKCAHRYVAAIERFHMRGTTTASALIEALAGQDGLSTDDGALLYLSQCITKNLPLPLPARRLFVDVTATCSHDLKTGIERVVRAIIMALLNDSPTGYRVEPVYLSDVGGVWHHRYARRYTMELLGGPVDMLEDEVIDPENGDVLLGLDISGDELVKAQQAGLFQRYRNFGVDVQWMVHDLLPVRMPEVFPPGANEAHSRWLAAISTFNGAICVSRTVADDLLLWQQENGLLRQGDRPFHIAVSHHGADVASSAPSKGMPDTAELTLLHISSRPTFLMVGTIEPRKAYLETIEAFTALWGQGFNINLVIVGKEGWVGLPNDMRRNIPKTVEKLKNHPEINKRLFWLPGISDEYLEKVYAKSSCLIAASYGEGFGLPLIEAAQYGIPIIARDIPVFREVAGSNAYYFKSTEENDMKESIKSWLNLFANKAQPKSTKMNWTTWERSAQLLVKMVTVEF